MRIRSTKPEFWRSERIASVSWDARLVLKGLESFVDDNGVGRDDLALIVGDLFQRDLVREPSRTLARVSEAISELNLAGLVHRYEAKDTRLLYLSFWESVQRVDKPQDGRFPRPDGTLNYKDSDIREPVATPRESSRALAPGTGEQGNRGTGEQISPSAVAAAFIDAYGAWPKKVEKKDAEARFKVAARKLGLEQLVAEVKRFGAAYASTTERQFVPALGGWLRHERWTDDLPGSVVTGGQSGRPVAVDPKYAAHIAEQRERKLAWLAQVGVSEEEFERRKSEPGWLDSLRDRHEGEAS